MDQPLYGLILKFFVKLNWKPLYHSCVSGHFLAATMHPIERAKRKGPRSMRVCTWGRIYGSDGGRTVRIMTSSGFTWRKWRLCEVVNSMESFGKSGPGDGETVGKHGTHGRDMLTIFVISVSSETRESLDDGERSSVEPRLAPSAIVFHHSSKFYFI
jgi:hypothetical protein